MTPAPTPAGGGTVVEDPTPTDGFAYLAQAMRDLANGIVDAFARFLALFTGSGGATPWSNGLVAFDQPVMTASGAAAVPVDVARLARQATFGPTPQVITRIAELGIPGWIDEQLRVRGSTYADLIQWVPNDYCANNRQIPNCWMLNFSRIPVAARFYADAVHAPDQLRQRVAFALSQIMVVSGAGADGTAGLASYQQLLLDNAFGNYRDLLGKVTLHGYMGRYLSMADSARSAPSENYAREMLQLFTMGPVQLRPDGTPERASNGATVPNYTPDDIRNLSRALTGWTFARSGGLNNWTGNDLSLGMVVRPGRYYDGDAKSFLGTTVPAGAAPEDSVRIALDAAFNHPSTPPRLARLLIQNLVTANPSTGYVQRIGAVFRDNGAGVRGDLRAVVRAILLDPEARGDEPHDTLSGKVKEPVLAMTGIARAVGVQTDGTSFTMRDTALGQPVFQAPSVFNFYPPDFPLPRSTILLSPSSKLMSAGGVAALQNMVSDWTINGNANRGDWTYNQGLPNFTGTVPQWQGWESVGGDVDRLIAVINLLLLDNTATAAQKAAMRDAALSITHRDAATQARRRAQALLYIAGSSPNFLVDR